MKWLITIMVMVAALGCTLSSETGEKQHSDVVRKLVDIVDSDAQFRSDLQAVLSYKERRDDNFWKGKSIEDLYDFLDAWRVFTPLVSDVRDFDDNFGAFYTNCPQGQSECGVTIEPAIELVRHDPFRNWIKEFVEARGTFMDSAESAKSVQTWMDDPSINMNDFIIPQGGFTSFNQFFTRNVKPDKRPIAGQDNKAVLVSPADCDIFPYELDLSAGAKIQVKGMSLNVSELLGGNPLASRFDGGKGLLLTLQATYYHHFHAPVSGMIQNAELLEGLYFGTKGFPQGFLGERHRGYLIFETEGAGLIAMVPVGIATISSVEFSHSAGDTVTKGDELGKFAYGGSAIVLMFEKDRLAPTRLGEKVQMGEQIGTLSLK